MDFTRLSKITITEADESGQNPDISGQDPAKQQAAVSNTPVAPELESDKDKKKEEVKKKAEIERKKKQAAEEKVKKLRAELIEQYTEENRDTSYIKLRPVKGSIRGVVPMFMMDISTDPYINNAKFVEGKIQKKIDDELDYNDIFVKDIEHMAKKIGIDRIEWKADSRGSKYFEIQLEV